MIRQAYRALCKRYHPDTSALPPEVSIRRFREIQEAYTILCNPTQRACYDAVLRNQGSWTQPPHRPSQTATSTSPLEIEMEMRPLSGTEWFVLVLMLSTFGLCLALVLVLAWLQQSGVS